MNIHIGNHSDEARISALTDKRDAIKAKGAMTVAELNEWYLLGHEVQALLSPRDTRHEKMFAVSGCGKWLSIYWGGYEYQYETSRLRTPEDLLWLVLHLSQKDWPDMTGTRVGLLIGAVSHLKEWQPSAGKASEVTQ